MSKTFKTFKIGTLTRTINIYKFSWGVMAVCMDKSKNAKRPYYCTRHFYITKKYNTIEANVKRALSYYKAPKD